MTFSVKLTGSACGAVITEIDLTENLSPKLVAELRSQWLENKVLIFPDQNLSITQLVRFSRLFGEIGEDPFFGHIEENENVAAIQRNSDEKTPIFAEVFHSDWSFLPVPPAGTLLYGINIPPIGGNTLFANQVMAYERLPKSLREKADNLVAIHSAALGYAPDGAYGEKDRENGRSMNILFHEKARETFEHPLVRMHHETGKRALFSSAAYIQGFVGFEKPESDKLLSELYAHQIKEEFVYSHSWRKNMLVMWDNRSVLHAATGGYDGYERLLYRTTIADKQF